MIRDRATRERRPRRQGPQVEPDSIGQELREHLARLEQAMRDLAGGEGVPHDFDPDRFLAPGVPRVRPLLVVLSARAAGADQEPQAPLDATEHMAVAAELLHVAIALHDAALGRQGGRRRRAARRLIGGAAHWLGGNHLTLRALELARHTPAPEAVGDLLDAMREITDGHTLARHLDGRLPTPDQSLDLADGRTAAVFAFACRAGARVATPERRVVHSLGRYGRHVGMAWHIAEDLGPFHLDPEERDRVLEERIGRGLPNFAVSLAATEDDTLRRDWEALHHEPDPGLLEALADRVSRSGAVEQGRRHIAQEVWAARQSLAPLPGSPARDSLDHLAANLAK